jgi:nitrate/nitrite-specific signal transduction histidine kinase
MVASESKAYIHSPVAGFQKTFFLISLLSLWIVIFLSLNQIRRSLIPLEKLKTGVQRIAKKEFDTKIGIGESFTASPSHTTVHTGPYTAVHVILDNEA